MNWFQRNFILNAEPQTLGLFLINKLFNKWLIWKGIVQKCSFGSWTELVMFKNASMSQRLTNLLLKVQISRFSKFYYYCILTDIKVFQPVHFYPKIYQFLYPQAWNSITYITIMDMKKVVIPRLKVGNDSSFIIGKLFFCHQKVLEKKLQHPNIKDTSPFFAILKTFN